VVAASSCRPGRSPGDSKSFHEAQRYIIACYQVNSWNPKQFAIVISRSSAIHNCLYQVNSWNQKQFTMFWPCFVNAPIAPFCPSSFCSLQRMRAIYRPRTFLSLSSQSANCVKSFYWSIDLRSPNNTVHFPRSWDLRMGQSQFSTNS